MAKRGAPQNLIPLNRRTKEEQKEIVTKGGIASGVARRERARMSQIYADFLESEFEVELDDDGAKKLTGSALVREMMKRIVQRGDSASVSIMKEMREAIEGSKVHVDDARLTKEERQRRIEELEAKRAKRR